MKYKPKNDTCGVPGKGFINASDYSQEDENNLIARAKRRGIDVHSFMTNAGFLPVSPQLELVIDEEEPKEPKEKRTRRTKEQIEADK